MSGPTPFRSSPCPVPTWILVPRFKRTDGPSASGPPARVAAPQRARRAPRVSSKCPLRLELPLADRHPLALPPPSHGSLEHVHGCEPPQGLQRPPELGARPLAGPQALRRTGHRPPHSIQSPRECQRHSTRRDRAGKREGLGPPRRNSGSATSSLRPHEHIQVAPADRRLASAVSVDGVRHFVSLQNAGIKRHVKEW